MIIMIWDQSLTRADPPILAGMVLIGSINGGHTSNLCTLIAAALVEISPHLSFKLTKLVSSEASASGLQKAQSHRLLRRKATWP